MISNQFIINVKFIIISLFHSDVNDNYFAHGEKVVAYFQTQNGGSLIELERIWRKHFLETMKPKFLPNLWSVEHNTQR